METSIHGTKPQRPPDVRNHHARGDVRAAVVRRLGPSRSRRDWMQSRYANQNIHGGVGGIGLLIILAFILPLATRELATLFTAERVRPYRIISSFGSALLIVHAFSDAIPAVREHRGFIARVRHRPDHDARGPAPRVEPTNAGRHPPHGWDCARDALPWRARVVSSWPSA